MNTEVWIFFAEEDRAKTATLRDTIREACKVRTWQLQERKTRKVRNPNGEAIRLVEPRDAVAVYKRMHRAHVAIIYLDAPRLCNMPPEDRSLRREFTIPFKQYCQHKAFTVSSSSTDSLGWLNEFENWTQNIHCTGDNDPRCLPFPTFESNLSDSLATPEERKKFEAKHHSKNGREDLKRKLWQLDPNAFHGHEKLHVTGHILPQGFHWDVQNETGKNIYLTSPLEVWVVKKYINVYPDGAIRGKSPYSWKVEK